MNPQGWSVLRIRWIFSCNCIFIFLRIISCYYLFCLLFSFLQTIVLLIKSLLVFILNLIFYIHIIYTEWCKWNLLSNFHFESPNTLNGNILCQSYFIGYLEISYNLHDSHVTTKSMHRCHAYSCKCIFCSKWKGWIFIDVRY